MICQRLPTGWNGSHAWVNTKYFIFNREGKKILKPNKIDGKLIPAQGIINSSSSFKSSWNLVVHWLFSCGWTELGCFVCDQWNLSVVKTDRAKRSSSGIGSKTKMRCQVWEEYSRMLCELWKHYPTPISQEHGTTSLHWNPFKHYPQG